MKLGTWRDYDNNDRPAQKNASVLRRLKRLRGRRRRQARRERRQSQSSSGGGDGSGFRGEMLALHNNAKPGSLRLNDQLNRAAQGKAEEMNRTGRMSHYNADGSFFDKRISRAGYDWRTCGENIAEGFDDPKRVFAAWMNSPAHKANIMAPKFDEVGFGYCDGWWATEFGAR